jgi:RecA-family ATPase
MGSRPDDSIYIFCAPSPEDGLEQLRTAAESLKPALILVDPLLRFSRIKDSNDYSQVTKALEPLHALARETGAHVLAVHHEAKRGGSGGDGVLGSTAIFASVDTLLIMKRNERYRTLSSIQRYGIDLEEITLQYDSETRTLSAGVSRSDADEADVAKDILEFLTTQTEPVDESAIQQAIVAQRAKQLKALRRLLDEGKLIRTGEGKKGDKYLYQIAGTQVPPIYPVPEKLDPKNPITASLVTTNAGTEPLLEFQSVDETPDPALTSTQERL